MKNYFNQNYGFVVLACLGVLYIPVSLYTFNAKELGFDFFLLVIPLIAAAVTTIFGFIFVRVGGLLSNRFDRINLYLQDILAAVGLIVFFNDFFVPTQATALDGSLSRIPEPVILSFIEIGIASAVFALILFKFVKNTARKAMLNLAYFSMIFLVLVFMASAYTTVINNKHEKVNDASIKYAAAISDSQVKQPNVYLVWLDAMQTEYFLEYIKRNDAGLKFPGFTLFRNNSANYLYTGQSYPSFMSGTIFKGGDYKTWSSNDRMRTLFKKHGYRITTYAKGDFLSVLDDRRVSGEKIFNLATGARHPYFSDYFVFWLVRSAPNFLANEVFSAAKTISGKLDLLINPASEKMPIRTIADGIEPFTGVKILEKLMKDESQRQGFGELVIAQAMLPHGPYVIDKDCSYRGVENSIPFSDKYYHQVACSSKLTIKFLDELKRLDRYDTSLIVVFGDHGSGWAVSVEGEDSGLSPLNRNFMPWNKKQVLSRVSALLMIKPPKTLSSGKFQISERESQLIDILPTTLDLMGWYDDVHGGHGISVFSGSQVKREKIFTYFAPSNSPSFNDAEIYNISFEPSNGLRDLSLVSSFNSYFSITPPSIELGKSIDFSAAGKSRSYLRRGWSGQEPTHHWTDGPTAGIMLGVQHARGKDMLLRMKTSAYLGDGRPYQTIGVVVNGREVATWQVKGLGWYEAAIPSNLVGKDGLLKIVFNISNPTAPCEVSKSSDCRKLGINARELVIVKKI